MTLSFFIHRYNLNSSSPKITSKENITQLRHINV